MDLDVGGRRRIAGGVRGSEEPEIDRQVGHIDEGTAEDQARREEEADGRAAVIQAVEVAELGEGATTVSRRRRLRSGVAEDADRAKRGDALRRIVAELAQKAIRMLAEPGGGRRSLDRARRLDR